MKISVKQLRNVIREVLTEMPYMRPHHMRGVGPDIDLDARLEKHTGGMVLTPEQVLLKYPEAAQAFVREMRAYLSRHSDAYVAQGKKWTPRDIMNLFKFYEMEDEKALEATSTPEYDEMMGDPTGSSFVWDPSEVKSWEIEYGS